MNEEADYQIIINEIGRREAEAQKMEDCGPHRAAELQAELSSYRANLNVHICRLELAYKAKLSSMRSQHKSAVDARIAAESTPEYGEWRRAELEKDALKGLIGSLRDYVRRSTEELRNP